MASIQVHQTRPHERADVMETERPAPGLKAFLRGTFECGKARKSKPAARARTKTPCRHSMPCPCRPRAHRPRRLCWTRRSGSCAGSPIRWLAASRSAVSVIHSVRNPQELSWSATSASGRSGPRHSPDNSKHATSACRVNIFIAQIPGKHFGCARFSLFLAHNKT